VGGILREGGNSGGTQNNNIYFNTIYLEGIVTASGGDPSPSSPIILRNGGFATIRVNMRNNNFYNTRTRPFILEQNRSNNIINIVGDYSPPSSIISDYNNFYVDGNYSAIGSVNASAFYPTLTDWQNYSGQDANSLSINPAFVNAGNPLLLPDDLRPNEDLLGIPGITDDYRYNGIRPNALPMRPTMGAWEMCKVIIIQQPVNGGGCDGEDAQFTVSAIGSGTLSYQWQISTDGGTNWINVNEAVPYSGVTTATLNITGITAAMNGYLYRCVVTSNVSITNPTPWNCEKDRESNAVTLSVGNPPTTSLIWHQ
jgi:hypothetical protein